MRTLVSNTVELRSALRKASQRLGFGFSDREWRSLKGCSWVLEAAAKRQRLGLLRASLSESGLPRPIQWFVEKKLKGVDFSPEELAAEIEAARKQCADPGVVEVKGVA